MSGKVLAEGYVIASKEGDVIFGSNARTEKEAWAETVRGADVYYGKILKKEFIKDGYRAVKVQIIEAE